MREVVRLRVEDATPDVETVLGGQGIPRWRKPDERTERLAQEAISIYKEKASPVGVMMEVAREEFKNVFEGEGLNHEATPVKPISQTSESLSLFAVTIGVSVCDEISVLFRDHDFALGSMLDSTASAGTEMTAQLLEDAHHKHLKNNNRLNSQTGILRFSPGYCGWHISGQQRLFNSLRPSEIGITLNDSFLMQPIKSISGVIVSGSKDIFYFDDVFPFCRDCTTHTCQERIKALMEQ